MKPQTKKFLEFNGKAIYFLAKEGQFWIALKPICKALGIDYIAQFKAAKRDKILGQLLSEQTMTGADNKLYKMVSLPEKYIYGWLFSIQSSSPELLEFKRECYEVLFNHFHGGITDRSSHLKNKTKALTLKAELIAALKANPEYQLLQTQEQLIKQANAGLKELDSELVKDQLPLWASETTEK
jgi:antirepressor protein